MGRIRLGDHLERELDVIGAERNLSQNKRDYARARYDYLINTMRLKQAAGILSADDVANINNLLN